MFTVLLTVAAVVTAGAACCAGFAMMRSICRGDLGGYLCWSVVGDALGKAFSAIIASLSE